MPDFGLSGVRRMTDVVSLGGPVELYNEQLTLRIPLAAGGDKLVSFARGIGEVEGEYLNIVIKPWVAAELKIGIGSLVIVDNCDGNGYEGE